MVVPVGLVKNAWVAVNVTALNQEVDSIQNPINKITAENSQQRKLIKPGKRFSFCWKLWKRFASTTTGHGFARMVDEGEPRSLRIFWISVILVLVSALLVSIAIISYETLVVRGLRREFIVQNNKTMSLPDIHICDTSLFNRTVLRGKLFTIIIPVRQEDCEQSF